MKNRIYKLLKGVALPVAAGVLIGLPVSNLTLLYLDSQLEQKTINCTSATAGSIAAVNKVEKEAIAPYSKKSAAVVTDILVIDDAAGLDYSDEESQMLLKLAMAEAENQGVIGKALVMNVVHNRMGDNRFPSTIGEVIFQENQFTPVIDGRYYDAVPDEECYEALEMVLNYWDGSNGALYFEVTAENTWHSNNLEYLFTYGDVSFYK